jgi:hypothetical protein
MLFLRFSSQRLSSWEWTVYCIMQIKGMSSKLHWFRPGTNQILASVILIWKKSQVNSWVLQTVLCAK